jgi:hypothetical protein
MAFEKKPRPSEFQNPMLARLDRDKNKSNAYVASPKLEKKLAAKVGGYRTNGSGNKLEKGDVRLRGKLRLEHKATSAASFRVTVEMFEKLELAARGCDEIPALVVEFLNDHGRTFQTTMAIIPLSDLMDLLNANAQTEPTTRKFKRLTKRTL